MPKFLKQPPPRSEEQIRPDALIKTIKKEKSVTGEKLKDIPATPENYKKFKGERRPSDLPRGIMWGAAGLIILFIAGSAISFYIAKEKVKQSIAAQAATLKAGVEDLQSLNTQSAAQQFSSLMGASSTPTLEGILGLFGSLFSGGKNAVASFGDLATQLAALSQETNSLADSGFQFVTGDASSTDLVGQLTSVRNTLTAINADGSQLSGALSTVGASSSIGGDFYLPLETNVESANNFLNVFIPWLASSTPHHVLILLQNTSEMRPGGGFLGAMRMLRSQAGPSRTSLCMT